MEKLYRALAWLAGIALVLGLFFAVIWYTPWAQDVIPQSTTSGMAGSVSLFLAIFKQNLLEQLSIGDNNVMHLLVYGATALGLALAWVERRWVWLAVMIVATLLTALWPTGIVAWQSMTPPSSVAQPPYPLTSPVGLMNFSILLAPLIPVALALIFALTHHQSARTAGPGMAPGLASSPQ